jgi:hypothetical protein
MRLLLVLAVGLLPVGVVMCWVGARSLKEQWTLQRRGIRVPAVAERWDSKVGSFGVYRFLDSAGRTQVVNAERTRGIPAAEVEIVYDPADITVARERFWLAEVVVAVVCVVTGVAVTVSGAATVVLAVVVFA